MGTVYNQVLLHWVDINGKPWTNFMTTIDQTSGGAGAYSALATAMQAVSHCGLVAVQYQTTLLVGNTPTNGDYPSGADRGVMLARIATSNRPTTLSIVGPKTDIFLPDHETVDLTNADVIAVQTEAMAVLGDTTGHANGPFIRGNRQRARGGP